MSARRFLSAGAQLPLYSDPWHSPIDQPQLCCRRNETKPHFEALSSGRATSTLGCLPLLLSTVILATLQKLLQPWAFMWTLAISIYLSLKWWTWWRAQHLRSAPWRSIAYLLAWPGMDAQSFLDATRRPAKPCFRAWFWATIETTFGAALLWWLARVIPADHFLQRGWIGMLGLIFLLHFGLFQLLALFWQSLGVDAPPIMASPLRAQSLSEFWGKRWNLGFRELAHELVFLPLCKHVPVGLAGFSIFLVSGLVHDLVISVPARAGYGLPTAYFLLQGLGVAAERSRFGRKIGLARSLRGRLFLVAVTTAPLFWLFHPAFVLRVVLPFMEVVHAE